MKKYRPYFSLPELKTILQSLKEQSNPPIGLIRYVDKFISEIDDGFRKESHTIKTRIDIRTDLAVSLGLDSESVIDPISESEKLYHRFILAQRSFSGFSSKEIILIQKYRYENDLMDREEESIFEKSQGVL